MSNQWRMPKTSLECFRDYQGSTTLSCTIFTQKEYGTPESGTSFLGRTRIPSTFWFKITFPACSGEEVTSAM